MGVFTQYEHHNYNTTLVDFHADHTFVAVCDDCGAGEVSEGMVAILSV